MIEVNSAAKWSLSQFDSPVKCRFFGSSYQGWDVAAPRLFETVLIKNMTVHRMSFNKFTISRPMCRRRMWWLCSMPLLNEMVFIPEKCAGQTY